MPTAIYNPAIRFGGTRGNPVHIFPQIIVYVTPEEQKHGRVAELLKQ